MKNKLSDVRNHLVAMLESLGDPDVGENVIERARVTSMVAGTYIQAVKAEIDACRVAADVGFVPGSIEVPARIQNEKKVLSFEKSGYRSVG